MYSSPADLTVWIEKFGTPPTATRTSPPSARFNFGETAELLQVYYEVKPAPAEPGTYRGVNGTTAAGLVAASVRSGLPSSSRAIRSRRRPSSSTSSRQRGFGVRTVQAEDEIAAANMALGASFGGHLGVTAMSGPGMDLKAET